MSSVCGVDQLVFVRIGEDVVTPTMSADLICAGDPVYCQPAARYGQTEACKLALWFCSPSSFSRGPGDVLGLPAGASADIVARLSFE